MAATAAPSLRVNCFPTAAQNLLERQDVYRPTKRDAAQPGAFARLLKDPTVPLRGWHQYIEDELAVEG